MLKFESDNRLSRIVLWNNEVPFDYVSNKKKLIIDAENNIWHEGTLCIEAKLNHRHASNYAMIKYIKTSKT